MCGELIRRCRVWTDGEHRKRKPLRARIVGDCDVPAKQCWLREWRSGFVYYHVVPSERLCGFAQWQGCEEAWCRVMLREKVEGYVGGTRYSTSYS